jgi:hypothetical protein
LYILLKQIRLQCELERLHEKLPGVKRRKLELLLLLLAMIANNQKSDF